MDGRTDRFTDRDGQMTDRWREGRVGRVNKGGGEVDPAQMLLLLHHPDLREKRGDSTTLLPASFDLADRGITADITTVKNIFGNISSLNLKCLFVELTVQSLMRFHR